MLQSTRWVGAAVGLLVFAEGCNLIFGLDERYPFPADAGMGGDGAGGGAVCEPSSVAPCYTGDPASTENVGNCKSGEQTCSADGMSYGACVGDVTPAEEDCDVAGDEDCDGVKCSEVIWASIHGDAGQQRVNDVAVDSQGNVFVTGGFDSAINFGNTTLISFGGNDMYLAKFSAAGVPLWAKQFGNASNDDVFTRVAVDAAGNVVMAGALHSAVDFGGGVLASAGEDDVFVVKLDGAGVFQWAKHFGDSSAQGTSTMAVDMNGDIVLAGILAGSISFGGANLTAVSNVDIFLAKLKGHDGSHIWSKHFGITDGNRAYGVAVDASNNIALVGTFASAINFGLSPDTVIMSTGARDIYLAKFSATGAHSFSQAYGDDSYQAPVAIAIDGMGNMIMTGTFDGSLTFPSQPTLAATGSSKDIWLAKLSPVGTPVWSKRFGGDGDDDVGDVVVDGSGNIVLTGKLTAAIDFGGAALESVDASWDIYLAKLNSIGGHLWSHQYGDAEAQLGVSLGMSQGSGEIALTSMSAGTIQFGATSLVSMGGYDLLVTKLAP